MMAVHFKLRDQAVLLRRIQAIWPKALVLIAIIATGAALRFNHLTQPFKDAFRWREVSTAMIASNFYHRSWNIFYPEVSWTGPAPGYQGREFQTVSYIAALLYVLFGEHDVVGRSVAVCFGLWGIFALYQLVRRIWGEERALCAAAIMALLPGSIYVDRSFLPDPAMVALMTTSMWMLISFLQTDRMIFLFLAAITGGWGVLTKLPGLVLGFSMVYATLEIPRSQGRLRPKKLAAIGVAAVMTLPPVAAYYLWALHLGHSYPPYHVAGVGNWLWDDGLKQWLRESYFLPRVTRNFVVWFWTKPVIALLTLGMILPVFAFIQRKAHQNRSPDQTLSLTAPWLFHFWMLGFVPYYLVGAKELADNPWNYHVLDPAAAALAGGAISAIAALMVKVTAPSLRAFTKATVILLCLVILFVWSVRTLAPAYIRGDQQGYELGLALREVSKPPDLVVTMASDFGDPIAIYYSQRRGWPFPPPSTVWDWMSLPDNDHESIQMFEELRVEGARWLGIVTWQLAKLKRYHPLLLAHFEHSCVLYRHDPKWVIYLIPAKQPINLSKDNQ